MNTHADDGKRTPWTLASASGRCNGQDGQLTRADTADTADTAAADNHGGGHTPSSRKWVTVTTQAIAKQRQSMDESIPHT